MKRLDLTRQQFKVITAVAFSLTMIFLGFVALPFVLPLFGVRQAVADLSPVVVCGICYAVIKRRPSYVECVLPDLVRALLRRCGVEVRHAVDE
jgi:hypothetical protein